MRHEGRKFSRGKLGEVFLFSGMLMAYYVFSRLYSCRYIRLPLYKIVRRLTQ